MNSGNYKRLGDYIRQVDVRNKDLAVTRLLGVSVSKEFMPSIANTIGTDMATYKIVTQWQFAYGSVTSRNGDKVSIALLSNEKKSIISQVYTVFDISDKNKLMPEYLMMWFRRSEFDRYARFHSHGSAREIFDWNEMCNVHLPIPPIERQQEIVDRYELLSHRISLNKRIISKLEETAQTIYRKHFVDGIDRKHLPKGWKMGSLGELADFVYGKMPNRTQTGDVPIFSGYGVVGYGDICMFEKQHIIVIARGDSGSGKIVLSPDRFFLTNLSIAVLLKSDSMKWYLYYHLLNTDTYSLRSGSAQAQVTINSLYNYEVMVPSYGTCLDFANKALGINKHISILKNENQQLSKLQTLLLSTINK